MTILKHFITAIMWLEIIGASLFLVACLIGVGLWGVTRWSERTHGTKEGAR